MHISVAVRKTIYSAMHDKFILHMLDGIDYGFCYALRDIKFPVIAIDFKDLPELFDFCPEENLSNPRRIFWFDPKDRQIRINILNNIIADL